MRGQGLCAQLRARGPSRRWFAFTRDLRRERTFTIDDLPITADAYNSAYDPPAQCRQYLHLGDARWLCHGHHGE
jgi:hypothetical protein